MMKFPIFSIADALEAAEKDRAQRKDWAVGAKVPA